MKEVDQNQIIATLKKMNRELMEENEHLRKQIMALEELAIDQKGCYNGDTFEEEYYENDDYDELLR